MTSQRYYTPNNLTSDAVKVLPIVLLHERKKDLKQNVSNIRIKKNSLNLRRTEELFNGYIFNPKGCALLIFLSVQWHTATSFFYTKSIPHHCYGLHW